MLLVGIVTYKDLMIICGYIDKETMNTVDNMYNKINNSSLTSYNNIDLTGFSDDEIEEIRAYVDMKRELKKNRNNKNK